MHFTTLCPLLEKSFWLPLEKFTIAPNLKKIPPMPMTEATKTFLECSLTLPFFLSKQFMNVENVIGSNVTNIIFQIYAVPETFMLLSFTYPRSEVFNLWAMALFSVGHRAFLPLTQFLPYTQNCVLQLFFLYLGGTYNRTLSTIVVKCFKSEPFLLNSFKLTFQSNVNGPNAISY